MGASDDCCTNGDLGLTNPSFSLIKYSSTKTIDSSNKTYDTYFRKLPLSVVLINYCMAFPISLHLGYFNCNIKRLTLPFFAKRPLLTFLIHWAAWILLYSFTYLPVAFNASKLNWEFFTHNYIVIGSVNFLLFYLVAFRLLPQVGIKKRRWIWLTIICLLLVIVFTFLKFRLELYRTEQALANMNLTKYPAFLKARWQKTVQAPAGLFSYAFRSFMQSNILFSFSIVFIAFSDRLLIAWVIQEKNRVLLENQKLKAELAFLEMQINPHFLFNALNNIYSLSVLENSKLTGNSLLKLSDLLRYMLYEKADNGNMILLDKEVRHINNYIDLEKMRHLETIYIHFAIEGDLGGKKIAPLLLFPLIENACKHGVLTDVKNPVIILLKVTSEHLEFSLTNKCNNYKKDKAGGIGIQNVKKRLELIYGDRHSFEETIEIGRAHV